MQLSQAQKRVLVALVTGCSLKSHRYLDGTKVYQLHPLTGPAETIERSTVELLARQGLIDSNKKFPAATYWLTEQGKALAIAIKERR